ncbi:MAG: winged helix-turn-helix domain-containing protein [Methanolobus sp.]|nr:winged helix-turn-helix domain-containing protein [Methanolobus sp.]
MEKSLLEILFKSEKRKDLLLLLQDGPQEMDFILKSMGTDRQALLPQMKILKKYHLIVREHDKCSLTTIGKLIVDEMVPLLETIEVFDGDIDYWGTHKIDFIPPHIISRIGELGKCDIISPSLCDLFDVYRKFYDLAKPSKSVSIITSYLYPDYSKIFSELLRNNIDIDFIVSEELFDSIKINHRGNFGEFIKTGKFHFYVSNKKIEFLSFTYDDFHLLLSLLTNKGDFDNKHVLCPNPGALEWARELFDHYLKNSIPVTEI